MIQRTGREQSIAIIGPNFYNPVCSVIRPASLKRNNLVWQLFALLRIILVGSWIEIQSPTEEEDSDPEVLE